MLNHLERITSQDLAKLSVADFDTMPFGMIRLDRNGVVTIYNAWEAQLARRDASGVLGKNFFTEIAPCTNVSTFRGKLDELVAAGAKTHIFDFNFLFPWGTRQVRIRFVIESDDERWVLVTNVK